MIFNIYDEDGNFVEPILSYSKHDFLEWWDANSEPGYTYRDAEDDTSSGE